MMKDFYNTWCNIARFSTKTTSNTHSFSDKVSAPGAKLMLLKKIIEEMIKQ